MNIYPYFRRRAKAISRATHKTMSDILHVGIVTAIKNFHNFNPDCGTKFTTYIMRFCIKKMWNHALNRDNVIQLPHDANYTNYNGGRYRDEILHARQPIGPLLLDIIDHNTKLYDDDEIAILYRAIDFLRPRDKDIVLSRLAGKTYHEIAVQHQRTKQLVCNRYQIILKKLKTIIESQLKNSENNA